MNTQRMKENRAKSKRRIIATIVGAVLVVGIISILIISSDNELVWRFRSGQIVGDCTIKPFTRCPGADMSGADLSLLDLHNADLTSVNLSDANLQGSWLKSSNLNGANLSDANLKNANISFSNLRGASLRGADLSNAELTGANLSNAELTDANLTGAIMCNTIMENGLIYNDGCRNSSFSELEASEIASEKPEIMESFTNIGGERQEALLMTHLRLPAWGEEADSPWVPASYEDTSGGPDIRSRIVLEEPGIIQVREGGRCAESLTSNLVVAYVDTVDMIIEGSTAVPTYANQATVFLNGWRLLYIDPTQACTASDSDEPCFAWQVQPPEIDNHVRSIKVALSNIQREGDTLSWEVRGHIEDDSIYDPFALCYDYITIAWNDALIDARVDHDDQGSNVHQDHHSDMPTSLLSESRYMQISNFAPGVSAGILPRGFQFIWLAQGGGFLLLPEFFPDRHILQTAYRIEQSIITQGTINWDTYGIFKDNDWDREYSLLEWISAISGQHVNVLQPPFSIFPREPSDSDACITDAHTYVETQHEIDNIPFEFAIPVLSGWEVWFPCDNEHVAEIGVRLYDIEYDRGPNDSVGTMRYKKRSVLRDADSQPGHRSRHGVSILGLRAPRPITSNMYFRDAITGFFSPEPDTYGLIRNDDDVPLLISDAVVGGDHQGDFDLFRLEYRGEIFPMEEIIQRGPPEFPPTDMLEVFEITQRAPLELLPGEELVIGARFAPTAEAPIGSTPRSAWIDFNTLNPRWPTIRLQVTGNTMAPDPDGWVMPTVVDFGSPSGSPYRYALIGSHGVTPLLIRSLALRDEDLGFTFEIQSTPQPTKYFSVDGIWQLDPGNIAVIQIGFNPESVGRVETMLIAETNAGQMEITLIGEGE